MFSDLEAALVRLGVGISTVAVNLPPTVSPKSTSWSRSSAPPTTASQDGPPRPPHSATTAAAPSLAVPGGDAPQAPPAQHDSQALGRYMGIGVVVGLVGCCLVCYLFRSCPWRASENNQRRRIWAADGYQGSRSIIRWPALMRGLGRRLRRPHDAERSAHIHELPAEDSLR